MFEFYKNMNQVQKGFTLILGFFLLSPIVTIPLSLISSPKGKVETGSTPSPSTESWKQLGADLATIGEARLPLEVVLELAAKHDATLPSDSAQMKSLGVEWVQSENAELLKPQIDSKTYNDVLTADGLLKSRCSDAPSLDPRYISSDAIQVMGYAQVFSCRFSLPCELGYETYNSGKELTSNIVIRSSESEMCARYNRIEAAEVAFINSFGKDNLKSRRLYVFEDQAATGILSERKSTLSILSFGCDLTWNGYSAGYGVKTELFGQNSSIQPEVGSLTQIEVDDEFIDSNKPEAHFGGKLISFVVPKSSVTAARSECIIAVAIETFEVSTVFGEPDKTTVDTAVARFWSDLPVHFSVPKNN